jgi:hypothetical protein
VLVEPTEVYGAKLFDEHARGVTANLYLGPNVAAAALRGAAHQTTGTS